MHAVRNGCSTRCSRRRGCARSSPITVGCSRCSISKRRSHAPRPTPACSPSPPQRRSAHSAGPSASTSKRLPRAGEEAMSLPTIEVQGERFHCRVDGPAGAPVLVLSNSLGTNLAMWDAQMPALSARFRVMRYDTRGHGASVVSPGGYALDTLGRDVLGLLDALKIARAHFCGLSMCGAIGMWIALNAPE